MHQAQISKGNSAIIIDWDKLKNREDTAHFQVRRTDLLGVKRLLFQVIDVQGNTKRQNLQITLPKKAEEKEKVEEEPRSVSAIGRALTSWAKLKNF